MEKPKSKKGVTLKNHNSLQKTAYPNDFIDFLGGKEAINKIDVYGHRIIFCILEMLKSIQVYAPKYEQTLQLLRDEMVIDGIKGRISTINTIKREEVEERRKLEIGKKLAIIKENYFADNFSMLQFIIPTRALNDNGNIQVHSNKVFHDQLEIFRTIGVHKVLSNDGKEKMISSLIDNPIFEIGQSYIRFYISKQTADILLNNSNGYADVYRNVVFKNSSPIPLNFYLFLKRKFGQFNGGTIKIEKLIDDLLIPTYCKSPSKLKNYLEKIKLNLDQHGNISFGYKISNGSVVFSLYNTPNTINVEPNVTADSYRAKNALKYIKKTRGLEAKHFSDIEKRFERHGYEKMKVIVQSKLSVKITGVDYYKWFLTRCVREDLL